MSRKGRVNLYHWSEVSHAVTIGNDYLFQGQGYVVEPDVVNQPVEDVSPVGSSTDSKFAVVLIDVSHFGDRSDGKTIKVSLEFLPVECCYEVVPCTMRYVKGSAI